MPDMGDFWQEAGVKRGSLLWPVAEKLEDMGKHAAAAIMREIGLCKGPDEPFVTGSRAYGVPRPDSDVDICCLGSPGTLLFLHECQLLKQDYADAATLRLPGYDVLIFKSIDDLHGWKRVNDYLVSKAPVTKQTAIEAFELMAATKRQMTQMGPIRRGGVLGSMWGQPQYYTYTNSTTTISNSITSLVNAYNSAPGGVSITQDDF